MSNLGVKKKSKRLTVDERVQLLHRLDAGESCTNVADDFGITKSAVTWIKKNKINILHQKRTIDDVGGLSNKKKRYSGVEESQLERYLYQWFVQKRSNGDPVSGPLLQEKALFFNQQLNGSSSFKASDGFLQRFKKRHGIRDLAIQGEKVLSDKEASDTFCAEFSKFVTKNGYAMDTVYNAAETGLYWKMIPSKTALRSAETKAAEEESPMDRVTVIVCTNASGTHKLPLMVIGKSEEPRCFKNVQVLPASYKSQKGDRTKRELTSQWCTEVFLPEIERVHGPNAKCVLLLDSAPHRPPVEELNTLSDMCIVKYLPSNVTALIQPMDQGIIDTLKKVYKKNLLRLVLTESTFESVEKLLNSLGMLQCCNFVASAWKDVTATTVRNGWRNLFPVDCDFEFIDYDLQPETFFDLASRIPGHEGITMQDTNRWLQIDNDCEWRMMMRKRISAETDPKESEESDISSDKIGDTQSDNKVLAGPTANDALRSIDEFMLWYQSHWDCKPETLDVLDRLRAFTIDQIVLEKVFCMDPSQ